MYIVKWSTNWADEMDIEGFSVSTDDAVKDLKSKLKSITKEFTVYVGSNENIDYNNGQELLNELTFEKITDEEVKTIKKYIGSSFGNTDFYNALDHMDEDEEYEEEDDEDDENDD